MFVYYNVTFTYTPSVAATHPPHPPNGIKRAATTANHPTKPKEPVHPPAREGRLRFHEYTEFPKPRPFIYAEREYPSGYPSGIFLPFCF